MKKFIILFLCSVVLGLGSVNAQQIRGDFNSLWVKDAKGNGALPGMYLRPGTQPVGWEASNVHQKVLLSVEQVLVTPDADRTGADGFSVKMENQEVGAMGITSGAPGYVTLGVPWVFAVATLSDCDGGTIGGVEYSQRPDSLVGYYKRTRKEGSTENALLLAYLWKGTSVSKVRTNPNGGLFSSSTTQVEDQDLCILGKKGADSGDAVLIGKAEYNIATQLDEWTRISIPVEYYTDDTPEKVNIILSAANYWVRSEINSGNFLWADDVELLCNAELKKLILGGEEVEGFNPKVYEYQLPASKMNEEIVAEGYGGNSSVEIRKEDNVAWIVVTDETAKGDRTYTYTLTFAGENSVVAIPELPEACVYGQEAVYEITSNNPAPIHVQSSDSSMLRYEAGKLKFLKAGTATITISQEGSEDFTAFQEEILVKIDKAPLTVKLKDATSRLARSATYTFEYEGLIPEDEELVAEDPSRVFSKVPQASGYNGASKVSATTPMGTYPIRWTQVPQADNYAVTADETEKTLTIGKGLAVVSYKLTRMEGEENPGLTLQELNFSNVLSADREHNPVTKTYYLKESAIQEGTASVVFDGTAPDVNSPAGKYPVTIQNTLVSDKYDFEIAEDNHLLVQSTPTIEIVNFPDEVYYGDSIDIEIATSNDADPTFLYYARKPDGEAAYHVSFSGSKMIAKSVGRAKIEVYVNASGHFVRVSTTKEFEVKKRPLTATVGNYTRDEGEVNPEFAVEYEGFRFEDALSAVDVLPTVTTEADEESPAGIYPITVAGGEAANYEIVPVNGALTVMGTPLLEVVNFPATVTYGDLFDVEYQLSKAEGLQPVFRAKEIEGVTNVLFETEDSPRMSAIGAGAAQIELVIEPSAYYYGTSVTKDFVIHQAPLTVTAEDTVRYVGNPNPNFVLKYEGFKFDDNEETEGVFITAPSATTDADENSPSGEYAITVRPGEAKNYAITPVDGCLKVKMISDVDAAEINSIAIYSGVGTISIKGNETREDVSVYDMLGTLLAVRNNPEVVIEGLHSNCIYVVKIGAKVARVLVK